MRKGKLNWPARIVLIVFCTALLVSLGWAVFRAREPRYQGKTVTEWMQIFYEGDAPLMLPHPIPEWEESKKAIDHFGTNIIPYALRLARTRDSALKQMIVQDPRSGKLAARLGFGTAYDRWAGASFQNPRTAVSVFRYLGRKATPTVPSLLTLLAPSEGPNTREAAALMLASVGAGAQDTLPDLFCYAKERDSRVRKAVQTAIVRISYGDALFARHEPEFPKQRAYTQRSEDLILPGVTKLLGDPQPDLGFLTPICSFLAWNEDWAQGSGFRKLLNDPNETVRTNTTSVLELMNSPPWAPPSGTVSPPTPILAPPPRDFPIIR